MVVALLEWRRIVLKSNEYNTEVLASWREMVLSVQVITGVDIGVALLTWPLLCLRNDSTCKLAFVVGFFCLKYCMNFFYIQAQ
jgi:hypothetical protein